jgi:hypothetical protein
MAILSELLNDVLRRRFPSAEFSVDVEEHGGRRGQTVTISDKSSYCVILSDDDFGGYLLSWVCNSASFSPPYRLSVEFLAGHFGHAKISTQSFCALDEKLEWFENVVCAGIDLMGQFTAHRNHWAEAAARYEELSANTDRNEYLEDEESS